jgi:hypothetical protein
MSKKPSQIQHTQSITRQEQNTIRLLERTLRPASPDHKMARRIKQRLNAEWLSRNLVILFVGVLCTGLLFGALRGWR